MPEQAQPTTRRWPRRLAIGGLVLVLLLGLGVVALLDRVPRDDVEGVRPGRLTVGEAAVGQWAVGSVAVALSEDGLRLTDVSRDDLVVWESPPGEPFVLGVIGDVTWTEHRGYFWADTRHECELTDQEVRSATDDGGRLEISGVLSGCGDRREFTVEMRPGPTRGDVVLTVESRDTDALALVSSRSAGAGVHGLGEQYAPFDLSGRLVPVVVREQGVGRGEQPLTVLADVSNNGVGGTTDMTYAAWPSFVTDDVRGVELDPRVDSSHALAVADARDDGSVVLTAWGGAQLRAVLTADTDPESLIRRREASQARPALPDWLHSGAVLGIQGGTATVRQRVAELTAEGAEISAVWLQDWTGTRVADLGDRLWWTWQLDSATYPEWDSMVADFAEEGIRTLTYANPWLVDAAEKGDPSIRNLFAEAAEADYLVRDPQGETYLIDQGGFDAALVDLTNPQARQWYADVIASEVLTDGVEGFMADFGEGLPFDAALADGDPSVEHNRWPLLWAQTVRQACEQASKPECVTWFRSGSGGMAQEAPMFWNGDQMVTYSPEDGMASTLLGTFSAGVSGWHLTHSDVGGYTSVSGFGLDYVRPPEMNRRWAELEAFGVMMRSHEGNQPDRNEQVYDTSESQAAFARMTRLYSSLAPYRAQVVAEAIESGVPAIRHGWLVYPGTPADGSDTQFFFGPSILVAPVMQEGADTVAVSFPPGTWVHLLTGEEYEGDRVIDVDAPLGTPAAFVRADDERRDDLQAMVADAGL